MIPIPLQVFGIFLLLTPVLVFCFQPRLEKTIKTSHFTLSTDSGIAISVAVNSEHTFSKPQADSITLLQGLGVEGDAHCGKTVQHRSRLHIRPVPPNLRQVHLIHSELFSEFHSTTGPDGKPYFVQPGDLGENITTSGLDLLALGVGTRLHFLNPGEEERIEGSNHPVVTVTGLRNPCPQISKFQNGLQELCLVRNASREIVERKAGIMTTVDVGGVVKKGARIVVEKPAIYTELPCV
jgi:MOSC domain-containing protein YiiM